MTIRPSLNIAVAKKKNKASEYNANFEMMLDYIDDTLLEYKGYVDAYMPAISASTKGKFLSNNGAAASWDSLGNQPFGSFIEGLILTKQSEDTVAISPGSCYDSTKAIILALATATTKQNENQAASSTYYVYIIGNGTNIDFAISTSQSSPTLPTGYIYQRQIGYYTTNSDNEINAIYSYGRDSNAPNPIAVVSETYVNGRSWYRVYSDGWCEQGGFVGEDGTEYEIELLKPYKDTDYSITYGLGYTNPVTALECGNIYKDGVTESSFKLYLYGMYYYAYWKTAGYIS